MSEPITPTPEYSDPKEIYAFFGLAFYMAQVLEQGLVNLTVALRLKGHQRVTTKDIEGLYEAIDKEMFGEVLKAARQLTTIPAHLDADLRRALKVRNHLAHKFFVPHALSILTDEGRRQMIDELRSVIEFIKGVDRKLDERWIEAWDRVGVSKDWIAEEVKRLIGIADRG